jgi:molecular chaperone GrpE (heat shock protein)
MDDEIKLTDYLINCDDQSILTTSFNKDTTDVDYSTLDTIMRANISYSESKIRELEEVVDELKLKVARLEYEYGKLYNETTGKIKDLIKEMSSEYVSNVLAVE